MPRKPARAPTFAKVMEKLEKAGVSLDELKDALRTVRFDDGSRGAGARATSKANQRLAELKKLIDAIDGRRSLFSSNDQTDKLELSVERDFQKLRDQAQRLAETVSLQGEVELSLAISRLPLGAANLADLFLRLKGKVDEIGSALSWKEIAVVYTQLVPSASKKGEAFDDAVQRLEDDLRQRASRFRRQVSGLGPDVAGQIMSMTKRLMAPRK